MQSKDGKMYLTDTLDLDYQYTEEKRISGERKS